MSVRMLLGIVLAMTTAGAQASSLVFPGVPSSTPSIIKLDAAKPLKTADAAKASNVQSVVGLGEAQPDVTYEKVSAITDKPEARHGFEQNPMIIRGGVVGPAFSAPAPSAAAAKAAAPETGTAPVTGTTPATGTAPATATASAAPAGDAGTNSASPPKAPARATTQPVRGVSKAN